MNASDILSQRSHRPWPIPERPWHMTQTWVQLLFAHWRVPVDMLRPLIPDDLDIDTYEGEAWLGIVPFGMRWVRPRYLPAAPWLSFFPELNVRTYVTDGKKHGVWFFSLDAGNPLAVSIARYWFHLPYYNAAMRYSLTAGAVIYRSVRTHRGVSGARFEGSYYPVDRVYHSTPSTLDHWLTERYCLYTADSQGNLYRGEIHHVPWPLQPAEAVINVNTLAESHGIRLLDNTPVLHFAKHIRVLIWSLEKLRDGS